MLFVSPHPGYQLLGIKQPVDNHNPVTGQYMSTSTGIDAEFIHGAPFWAKEQFINHPKFVQRWGGLPDEVDRYTMFGSYDTDRAAKDDNWDAVTKKMVEETLLGHSDFNSSYFLAEQADSRNELPWPNYENTPASHVLTIAKEIGANLEDTLFYERNHRNRKTVVEALEQELGAPTDLVAA